MEWSPNLRIGLLLVCTVVMLTASATGAEPKRSPDCLRQKFAPQSVDGIQISALACPYELPAGVIAPAVHALRAQGVPWPVLASGLELAHCTMEWNDGCEAPSSGHLEFHLRTDQWSVPTFFELERSADGTHYAVESLTPSLDWSARWLDAGTANLAARACHGASLGSAEMEAADDSPPEARWCDAADPGVPPLSWVPTEAFLCIVAHTPPPRPPEDEDAEVNETPRGRAVVDLVSGHAYCGVLKNPEEDVPAEALTATPKWSRPRPGGAAAEAESKAPETKKKADTRSSVAMMTAVTTLFSLALVLALCALLVGRWRQRRV